MEPTETTAYIIREGVAPRAAIASASRSTVVRTTAVAALVGQIALVVGALVATLIQGHGYDAARHDMSDMAAIGAPHAWLVLAYMGFAGATTILFAWLAFRPLLAGARGRTMAAVLVTLTWGLGNASDVFFRIDCRVADGCSPEQQIQSWHAVVHASTTLLLLPLIAVPFVVARVLRRSEAWQDLVRPSRILGGLMVFWIVVSIALGTQWGAGYAQRLFLLVGACWMGMLSLRAVRLTDGGS